MIDKPVGIGQAINEATERQEWEAIRVIGEHIAHYLLGGPDLETEDIELGKRAGVHDLSVIELRWKVARKKAKAREAANLKVVEEEAAAFLKKPEVQPSVELQRASVEPAKKRGVVRWKKLGGSIRLMGAALGGT